MTETNLLNNTSLNSGGFLEPERLVQYFGLEKGDYAADFGAGHGFFTMPMAREVGNGGKIYAFDIQKPVLEVIRAKARINHLLNIEIIWADLDEPGGSRLRDNFMDFVVIANILFQAEKKDIVMQEAYRILRAGGRMAAVEWDAPENIEKSGLRVGPPADFRLKKEQVKELALQAGFRLDREFEAGSHHYGLLFKKP